MPLISVLTAAFAPAATYLDETIASVRRQTLPANWELEWIIQEDGEKSSLSEQLEGLDFVHYQANEAQLGVAATRNFALSRASGALVHVLDHDDILLPGALNTIIPRFTHNRIHWAIGQADDLMPDGTRIPWDSALPYGIIPAGQVNEWARAHDGNWPIHCAGLTLRMESLRAIGGWSGVPSDDDIAMFAALSEISDGYNDQTVTWLYRQHRQQTNRTTEWQNYSAAGRRIALQRAAALRLTGLSFDPVITLDFNQNREPVTVGASIKKKRNLD